MRLIKYFIVIILLLPSFAFGATYYIDYVTGDDVRTAEQAQNPATPWKQAPGMTGNWQQITGGWTETSTNIWQATAPVSYAYELRLGTTGARPLWQAESNWKGQWVTATAYSLNNYAVGPDGKFYRCIAGHTSNVFADDLAAGRWAEYVAQFSFGAAKDIIVIYSVGNPDTVNGSVWVSRGAVATRSGYTHSAGDIFVFKGGITWPADSLPFTVQWSGAEGTPDVYMSGHMCGSAGSVSCNGGAAWGTGYAVIDGEGKSSFSAGIIADGKSDLIFDGLKIVDTGNLNNGSGEAIRTSSGSRLTIKNGYYEPNGVNGFSYSATTGTHSAVYFYNNTVRRAGRVHVTVGDATCDDFQFYNNTFIAGDYNPLGYHLDGFMIGADGAGSFKATNLKIHHNKLYGDWSASATGMLYLNGSNGFYGWQYVDVYNNLMVTENNEGTPLSPGLIVIYANHGDVKIYNNTLDHRSNGGNVSHCIDVIYGSNIDIQNNILTGCDNGITVGATVSGTVTLDYNLYYTDSGNHLIWDSRAGVNGRCNSISECQGTPWFQEANGKSGDPKFVSLPSGGVVGSGDWNLQSDSPARNSGADLSAIFTTDITGATRVAWDIGAYEYDSGYTPPAQHTLTVTKAGTGAGTVTSSPAGINCGSTCTYDYDESTEVTLTATPTGDNVFAGWSGTGGCTGTSTCVLTMSEAKAATATFNLPAPTVTSVMSGGVISGGVMR